MATTINASAVAGLVQTADTSTILQLQTGGTTAVTVDASQNVGIGTTSPSSRLHLSDTATLISATSTNNSSGLRFNVEGTASTVYRFQYGGTTQATIDSSGNLGLGVTPSAWTDTKAIQIGQGASVAGGSTQNGAYLMSNTYYGSGWKYIGTGYAIKYEQNESNSGAHKWYTAASGTAGNTISFTQAMTLDASGNLIVGGTSATNTAANRGNITINGTSTAILSIGTGGTAKGYVYHSGTDMIINATTGTLALQANGSGALIDSSGNLGLGVTPSAFSGTNGGAIQMGAGYTSLYSYSNAATLGSNVYYNAGNKYFATGVASSAYQQAAGVHYWLNAPSGTAGGVLTFTQAMTLDSSGNLLVGTTSNPAGVRLVIGGTSGTARIEPVTDNVGYIGESSYRWQAVYAVNGTIQTSDGREKNTIEDSNLGLSFVNALRPVSYKWNVGENVVTYDEEGKEVVTPRAGVRVHYGFIAQEVKAAIPEGVDFGGFVQEPDEGRMSLRYHEFIGPLVKAIQEQQALITQLTARITALEGA